MIFAEHIVRYDYQKHSTTPEHTFYIIAKVWQKEYFNSQPKSRRKMEENLKAAMANYNDDSIRTMEGLKHIRLRPGMYIGALGDGSDPKDGIYTLLKGFWSLRWMSSKWDSARVSLSR